MSQKLNIGQKSEDFSSFKIAIQQYQNAENVQFFRRNSRTIAKAQPRMPENKLNERLKYYEIQFHCIRGGKNFKSRSTGMREQRYKCPIDCSVNYLHITSPNRLRFLESSATALPKDATTKYPTEKERFVKRIEVLEQGQDTSTGIDYRRSVAVCANVVPNILRKIHILNEAAILLEERAWLDFKNRKLRLESQNITWSQYARMQEKSLFQSCEDNPKWTIFEQHGMIDVNGIGPFGKVIEMFAERFLHAGVKRSLSIMEELLHERYSNQERNS